MAERNEEDVAEYPVRYVEVRSGVSEDGGGIAIVVRSDGDDLEKVVLFAYNLFFEIAQNGVERKERKEKAKEVI